MGYKGGCGIVSNEQNEYLKKWLEKADHDIQTAQIVIELKEHYR